MVFVQNARRRHLAGLGPLLVLLSGCSGSGVGLNSNGQPVGSSSSGGSSGSGQIMATFESIQQNVFTPICSVCHIGAGAPEGLRLDAADSYNLIVNVASTEEPTLDRIKPGDPTNSYLIQKIQGHAAVGGQMPLGEAPLPSDVMAAMVQWVTDGAQAGSATSSNMVADFRVEAVAPQMDDLLTTAPPQIMVGFTRELDQNHISPGAWRVERVGDAGSESATSTAVRVSVPISNPRALLLTPASALTAGHYLVVLSEPPADVALASLNGDRLVAPLADANGDRLITRFTVIATP